MNAAMRRFWISCIFVVSLVPVTSAQSPKKKASIPLKQTKAVRLSAEELQSERLTESLYKAAVPQFGQLESEWIESDVMDEMGRKRFIRVRSRRVSISHNIERTNSLTSPYVGTIVIEYLSRNNGLWGWDIEEKARKMPLVQKDRIEVTHKYAYQNGRWVHKGTSQSE